MAGSEGLFFNFNLQRQQLQKFSALTCIKLIHFQFVTKTIASFTNIFLSYLNTTIDNVFIGTTFEYTPIMNKKT